MIPQRPFYYWRGVIDNTLFRVLSGVIFTLHMAWNFCSYASWWSISLSSAWKYVGGKTVCLAYFLICCQYVCCKNKTFPKLDLWYERVDGSHNAKCQSWFLRRIKGFLVCFLIGKWNLLLVSDNVVGLDLLLIYMICFF